MNQTLNEIVQLISKSGKYELKEENTEGMNSYAFVAKHMPLNRDVFLKIYDASPERADIFEEPRFLVEATDDNSGSTNLVRVLDAEKLNENWVLVAMELVDGGSLFKAIENGPLPLMEAIHVAKEILYGLSQLHNSCLVHRDIKPANILLTTNNDRLNPKLGDFGSVARLSSPEGTVKASRHSALYVPPEGWEEPSLYNIQSDIYQVGIVLYEMVNGPLPYHDDAYLDRQAKKEIKQHGCHKLAGLDDFVRCQIVNQAIARRAASKKLLAIVEGQPYVPRVLKQVINKATHPEYNQRYSNASDMLNALNELHFPNWELGKNNYYAKNWNDWDWKVEEKPGRNGLAEIQVFRSRCGCNHYRRWYKADHLLKSFTEVLQRG